MAYTGKKYVSALVSCVLSFSLCFTYAHVPQKADDTVTGTIAYLEVVRGGRSGTYHFDLMDLRVNENQQLFISGDSPYPSISPSEQLVATVARTGVTSHSLYLYRLDDLELENLLPPNSAVSWEWSNYLYEPSTPVWSSSSRWLAFPQTGSFLIFDLKNDTYKMIDQFPNQVSKDFADRVTIQEVHFAPDNELVALELGINIYPGIPSDRTILIYRLENLSLVLEVNNITDFMTWTPDSDSFFYTTYEDDEVVLNEQSLIGEKTTTAANKIGEFRSAVWNPDGSIMAYTEPIGDKLWNIRFHGDIAANIESHLPQFSDADFNFSQSTLRWSTDGLYLAYPGGVIDMQTNRIIESESLKSANSFAWAPTGHWLAFTYLEPEKGVMSMINVESGETRLLSEKPFGNCDDVFAPCFYRFVVLNWLS